MGTKIDPRTFETDPIVEEAQREVLLRRDLLMVPLKKLMQREPIVLPPSATVAEAVELMNKEGLGAILVTEADVLIGIFTERDVLRKIAGRKLDFSNIHIAEYMTPRPETLGPESPVAYALNMMVVGGFRHVPVVDEHSVALGMISVRDIIAHIVEVDPKDTLNLPSDPSHEMRNLYGG